MRMALRAVKKSGAKRVVVAVPVAPHDTLQRRRPEADEIVCLDKVQHRGELDLILVKMMMILQMNSADATHRIGACQFPDNGMLGALDVNLE